LRLSPARSRQFGFKLGDHGVCSNAIPCALCVFDRLDAPAEEFSLVLAFQNSLAYCVLNEFGQRFTLRKHTLNLDPELGFDANGGDGCGFHGSIVLQLHRK